MPNIALVQECDNCHHSSLTMSLPIKWANSYSIVSIPFPPVQFWLATTMQANVKIWFEMVPLQLFCPFPLDIAHSSLYFTFLQQLSENKYQIIDDIFPSKNPYQLYLHYLWVYFISYIICNTSLFLYWFIESLNYFRTVLSHMALTWHVGNSDPSQPMAMK